MDVPAKEEVGHWEEEGYWKSDWVYECNGCGQQFSTEDAVQAHIVEQATNNILSCGGYASVPGNKRWIVTGQHWVVDTPAQEEIGHWEYK